MVDLYLLEELVSFQKNGTLAKTAQELAVTQPTITRGMQKLEDELGVKLFKREPNRITLTKVGKFAAQEAQKVINFNQAYTTKVKNFALSTTNITVAANAPGPIIILKSLGLRNLPATFPLISDHFRELLLNRQYTCLLLNQPLKDSQISSIYLGTEDLAVHLNEFTDLASKKAVSFAQLKNITFLVFYDIGVWRTIIQKEIPGAKFLYQDNPTNFTEIRNNSIFPYFTTNLSPVDPLWREQVLNDRREVKLTNPAAHQQFYACFLTENQKRLQTLIQKIQDKWAEVD